MAKFELAVDIVVIGKYSDSLNEQIYIIDCVSGLRLTVYTIDGIRRSPVVRVRLDILRLIPKALDQDPLEVRVLLFISQG